VEPLTVRDRFSRYLLTIHLLKDQRWEAVQGVFMRLGPGKYAVYFGKLLNGELWESDTWGIRAARYTRR